MGTNYYLHRNVCAHCGRGDEPLHIGKSSGGWCFSLATHPDLGINDLADWQRVWTEGGVIRDEYDHEGIGADEMLSIITERNGEEDWSKHAFGGYVSEEDFHARNGSERGPNGMLRHKLKAHGSRFSLCVKHGSGTWDCMEGVFR